MAMTKAARKIYDDCRRHVLDAVVPLSDADYLEVLEMLSTDLDCAVESKREEVVDDE